MAGVVTKLVTLGLFSTRIVIKTVKNETKLTPRVPTVTKLNKYPLRLSEVYLYYL